jgi:hypothetical protein
VVKKPSLDEMRALARQKAIDKAKGVSKATPKEDPARSMAYAYEEVLGLYIHKPALNFIKKWDPHHRNSNYFRLAAERADSVGADHTEFVWAQFYFMHTWYGREARPHELRSKAAIERWENYTQLKADGTISGEGKVYSSALPTKKMSWNTIDKINNGRLVKLMRVWNLSAEEVIINFADTEVFDEKWLKKNPIYLQLKSEGRV